MDRSRVTETQGNHDLLDAFANEGCAVCALVTAAVSRYMGSTNYDAVGDPEIRRQFEASLGFCNQHAHQWLAEAFVLGTAQMYRDILRRTDAALTSGGGKGGGFLGRGKGVAPVPVASAPCPACEIERETGDRLVRTLGKGLNDAAFRNAYLASDGLCLPHLRVALGHLRGSAADVVRERAHRTHQELIAHLDEAIRKHDYRFRHEPAGDEKSSPARAVAMVAGAKGVGVGEAR